MLLIESKEMIESIESSDNDDHDVHSFRYSGSSIMYSSNYDLDIMSNLIY